MAPTTTKDGKLSKRTAPKEIGSLLPGMIPSSVGAFWSSLLDEGEYVPKLRWPMSRPVYDEMSRDGQMQAIWNAYTLPIRAMKWEINANGADPAAVQAIAEDLGLPVQGAEGGPVRRSARRFNFDEFLSHALLALRYGFTFFEVVGEYRDDDYSMWRLRKLAPRIPTTIDSIKVAEDGGLDSIMQSSGKSIPVSQLVGFTWNREGANYYGQSIFRGAYKYWALKDKLLRIDAISKDRNGMGVPWAKATDRDVDQSVVNDAFRAATSSRVGQRSGGALPFGVDIEYKGVTGAVPNTLDSIKYMDEQMTRSTLTQFLMLGQTQTGSYSLGESFIDFFKLAIDSVCQWFVSIVNRYVIDPWVEFNYGSSAEYAPELRYDRQQSAETDVTQLVALMDKGAITADPELEQYLRAQVGVPQRDPNAAPAPVAAPPAVVMPPTTEVEARGMKRAVRREQREREAAQADAEDDSTDGYTGRLIRDPRDEEADTPFEAMDTAWAGAKEKLVDAWLEVQAVMDEAILEQVKAAGNDIGALSDLAVDVPELAPFVDVLIDLVTDGVESALEEASRQGVELATPDVAAYTETMGQRMAALATVMVADYANGVSRQAMRLVNGAVPLDEVLIGVKAYLENLSGDYVDRQFSDLASTAMGSGRQAVFEEAEDDGEAVFYHATALLDGSTCGDCAKNDGHNYETLPEALLDFPTGKYKDCQGRERCRCFIIARYEEFPASA